MNEMKHLLYSMQISEANEDRLFWTSDGKGRFPSKRMWGSKVCKVAFFFFFCMNSNHELYPNIGESY